MSSSNSHSSAHSALPSPLPPSLAKPVRKLSNAAMSAITAGESAFHALRSQVGGHPGVLASDDNLLIVKSCLDAEKTFYELLALGDERLEGLRRWIPRFYGTLRLEGKVADDAAAAGALEAGISVVLENVSSSFTKPNIMDLKLGTVLYEESAPPEKRERMLATARETTSLETGLRLTGFQVYDHTSSTSIITPKSYGKSIKASDLPDGMRRFFPLSLPSSSSSSPEGQGLPKPLLLPIIRGVLKDVRTIRDALARTELRMVGGSLLIVYEADWEAARSALETNATTNSAGVEATKESEGELGYDSDAESEEEEAPAYSVRLIDFAHTRLTPGDGPDSGVLKGVDTTIRLLEGRIQELESS
ncbi:SAICAR synthase-like protein [Sanghuangporus baumii]|uniref:Kinase n=1 Tax=Sanghuangporus baumii TaxID=108892 RepID=A0A9Q5NAM3_SANBA|nr:SAICAR synthase-like protein [Sanghuangporus baumii]